MTKKKKQPEIIKRAPVVVVMGHIDHGKSTLLDYIRKENTVDTESGGITQHVSAYEAQHNDQSITFIDTPGHEAFAKARSRGANIADLAILVVAADDGVSAQTIGALEFIKKSKIPFLVAINKIDKPNADIEKTKMSLIEHEVYLEGMGGDISYIEISALKGTGINQLLDTLLLMSDMEEFKTDKNAYGSGYVLESEIDTQKGISATLILKEGSILSGQYIVSGLSSSPVRIMENFKGTQIKSATATTPVKIIGFDTPPQAGDSFSVFENKKEALRYIQELRELQDDQEKKKNPEISKNNKNIVSLVIKADTIGSLDAIRYELNKIENARTEFKIVHASIGNIGETAIRSIGSNENSTIIGFHVDVENKAKFLAENLNIEIKIFDIIYELVDYLEKRLKNLTPKEKFEEIVGEAKILKVFSWTNKGGVIGGEVISGKIKKNNILHIYRRNEFIGKANIKQLQSGKKDVAEVSEETQFGLNITSKLEVVDGDIIKSIEIVEK